MLKRRLKLAGRMIRRDQQLARAARNMPKPARWEWARPRLVPLLAGPCFDRPGEGIVRTRTAVGCAVEFGLDLGAVFAKVDERVAERWECTPEQLLRTGLANLERRVGRLTPADVGGGALSGRVIQRLDRPRGCAASLVLLPDHLVRLLGDHDQVVAVPGQGVLVSFPLDTPPRVLADAVVDLESSEPLPLMYDPFVLLEGRLHWQPDDDGPGFAEQARFWPAA